MTSMTINWTDENASLIEAEAKETGLSISDIANKAIDFFLGRSEAYDEDAEDIAAAEKTLAEIQSGRQKVWSSEEVWKQIGI